jgi:hypothetical protein
MVAGNWRKASVKKAHITDNQDNYACVAAENVRRLRNRQSEKACRIRTNSTRPDLSLADVN